MKPYLAVIFDSFREALASRVLWLVIFGISLFLLVLAPVGLKDEVNTQFKRFDIVSGHRLTSLLVKGVKAAKDSPLKRITGAMDDEMRKKIQQHGEPGGQRLRSHEIIDALNALLKEDDQWYDAELWKSTTRLKELRDLDEKESLSPQHQQRRARLRIEAALPGAFQPRQGEAIRLRYAVFDFPDDYVFPKAQFTEVINRFVLPLIINLLLGVFGVFVAILVTASIIPEMFQSGSLQLLLSKPVSRSILYVSKFAGGCAFVFLSITNMIVGLWLIAGFRLDIWNHRLLLCIPLFVFLFMVYYSVSSVAGLIWRNAIVSIAITVFFWLGCFIESVANAIFIESVVSPATVTQLVESDENLFVATRRGELMRLPKGSAEFNPLLESEFGSGTRIVGPIKLSESGRILAAQIRRGRFSPFSGRDVALQIFSAEEQWKPIDGIQLPPGTREIFPGPNDSVIAFGTSGIARAEGNGLEPKAEDDTGGMFNNLLSIFRPQSAEFKTISPASFSVDAPMSACPGIDNQSMIVYSRGKLSRLDYQADRQLKLIVSVDLEGESSQRAAVAASGDHIVLIREESGIEVYNYESLELQESIAHEESLKPQTIVSRGTSESEHFLVLMSNGQARLLDASGGKLLSPSIPGQGEVHAAHWRDDGQLLLAHNIDQISTCSVPEMEVDSQRSPRLSVWRTIYTWAMHPIHTIAPKPGTLGETVQSVVIGDDEMEAGPPSAAVDLAFERQALNVWAPVINCGIFTILILGIGCLYIARQDF